MLHHPPTLPYSGLTVVLDRPSRHDKTQLISGYAGQFFESCLQPLSRFSCDIRTAENSLPLIDGTKLVLYLGEDALKLVKPDSTLNDERGCPFIVNEIPRIASYSPQEAFDRRSYEREDENESEAETTTEKSHQKTKRRNFRFWLYNDLRKSIKLTRNGLHSDTAFEYRIFREAKEIIEVLRKGKNQLFYLDIETDKALNLTCFGFSFLELNTIPKEGHPVYVVPFKRCWGKLAYAEDDIRFIIQALCIAVESNLCVLHNSLFDLFVLAYKYHVPPPRNIFDTMLAFSRCYPEAEKSLGHCISYFTNLPFHKNDGIFDPKTTSQEAQLWAYNGKDISSLILVYLGLLKEIDKLGAAQSVLQANRSIRPYLTMMFQGCRIDIGRFLKRFEELEADRIQLNRCLEIVTSRPLNPRSPKQVAKYLYGDLGFTFPEKDPTNEKTLLKLLTKKEIPSIKLILASRGKGKAASSLKFRLWNQGNRETYDRLTCAYGIAGTDTFRLSSKALLKFKPDPGFGTNCQNWAKEMRDLVVADEGKVLGQTDQAGAEALIVAYLCRPGKFRDLFTHGIKPHVYVAMRLFKDHWAKRLGLKDINEFLNSKIENLKNLKFWSDLVTLIKDDEEKYYVGKKTCHSANYDIKGPTFQMSVLLDTEGKLVLSLAECKSFLALYRDMFMEIPEWHAETQGEVIKGRVLKNLYGYPRRFLEPVGEGLFKQAYAFRPQSTVATITNIAVTELQEKIDKDENGLNSRVGLDLLQNGHDSILWQAKIGNEVEAAKLVKQHIEKPLEWKGVKFQMKSETAVGNCWRPYDKDNCPDGLKEIKL